MLLHASSGPVVAQHDLLMLDLDGVVYRGEQPVPHAIDAIAAVRAGGTKVAYLTNNASRTAAEVSAQIRDLGLEVDDADVVTAGEAIARIVAEALPHGSAVLVVGGPGLIEPLRQWGLHCVPSADDGPVAVVQGFHPDVGWRNLAEASYAIQAGAAWFASNIDQTFPSARGTAPGNGSLVETVRRATGAVPVVAGKPEPGLFDEVLRRTGATRPLMVGDRVDTDIVGALNAGIPAFHVLTGISGLAEIVALLPSQRPHYVAPDLRALWLAHEPIESDAKRSMCGSAVAATDADGTVRLESGVPGSLEAVRAVVAAAWHCLDETGQVARLAGPALEH